jgi:hypothetical protein
VISFHLSLSPEKSNNFPDKERVTISEALSDEDNTYPNNNLPLEHAFCPYFYLIALLNFL